MIMKTIREVLIGCLTDEQYQKVCYEAELQEKSLDDDITDFFEDFDQIPIQCEALDQAFIWEKTDDEFNYWNDIYESLLKKYGR